MVIKFQLMIDCIPRRTSALLKSMGKSSIITVVASVQLITRWLLPLFAFIKLLLNIQRAVMKMFLRCWLFFFVYPINCSIIHRLIKTQLYKVKSWANLSDANFLNCYNFWTEHPFSLLFFIKFDLIYWLSNEKKIWCQKVPLAVSKRRLPWAHGKNTGNRPYNTIA